MRLLRALDRAFTTFVNEVFPFPVFPSLDHVADEIVRREQWEEPNGTYRPHAFEDLPIETPVVDVAGAGVPTAGSPPEAVSPTVSGGHSLNEEEALLKEEAALARAIYEHGYRCGLHAHRESYEKNRDVRWPLLRTAGALIEAGYRQTAQK